ncbi:MAG: hypothetical protein PHS80_06695 [Methanothrix sp.]|nr:hypothetical protein [Methanothrix sp.]
MKAESFAMITFAPLSTDINSRYAYLYSYDDQLQAGRKLIKVDPWNILLTGMEQPVVPIEPKPLHHISVMQVLAMKWEAAPFRTR